MGVNCIILLPPDVRLHDAADVIGILAGLPCTKQPLGDGHSYSCHVDGIELEKSLPEMVTIVLSGDLVDGEKNHSTTWHWEPDSIRGERLLYPRASGFWVAVGKKLVDFFGGSIVYCDCNGEKPDYVAKKPRKRNNPSDGKPWHDFQDEKLNLTALTQADLQQAEQWSAYKSVTT